MADKITLRQSRAFLQSVKRLRKRYPNVRKPITDLIQLLQNGETPGDQVAHTGHTVYKVRLPNPDALRGKSGGFRVLYYLKTDDNVFLLLMYSKTDRSDVIAAEVKAIIDEL